jgi:hypothetical protein
MMANQATYALLRPPSFDVLPDTDVRLGSIHPRTKSKPRRPDTQRILNKQSRIDVPRGDLRTRIDPSVVLDHNKLRSGGAGINLHLPFLQGVGGDISGQGSNESFVYITAKNLETQWFIPDDAYFEKALQGVAVREQLLNFRSPSIFLVTGVKIADSANIIIGYKKEHGGELGPEIDLTSLGIPIEVGASINAKRKDHRIVVIQKKTKFVLAFETRRIRKKKSGFTENSFNDGGVLDDQNTGRSTKMTKLVDYGEVANEVDDDDQ